MNDRIVAVGFLTAEDLAVLGDRFARQFPVEHDDVFGALLGRLDAIEVAPLGRGVVLRLRD